MTEIERIANGFEACGIAIAARGGQRNELIGRCYQAVLPPFMTWLMTEVRDASANPAFRDEQARLTFYSELGIAASASISHCVANLVGAIAPNLDISRAEAAAQVMSVLTPLIDRTEREAQRRHDVELVTYLNGDVTTFDLRTMLSEASDGQH